jgi:hypothetical protein
MKNVKVVWGLMQFFKQNDPKVAKVIGNISLCLGMAAALPIFLSPFIVVPTAVMILSAKAAATLMTIKTLTKTFGIVDENGNEINTEIPKTLNEVQDSINKLEK